MRTRPNSFHFGWDFVEISGKTQSGFFVVVAFSMGKYECILSDLDLLLTRVAHKGFEKSNAHFLEVALMSKQLTHATRCAFVLPRKNLVCVQR